MRAAFVLLIVGSGLLVSMWSRFVALLLYLWFALFRPQEWSWGALNQLHLSYVIGLALVVPSFLTGAWPTVNHPLALGSLAMLAMALIAQIGVVDPASGWQSMDPLAVAILVSLLMVRLIDTRDRLLWTVMVMAGSLGFYAAKFGVGFIIRGGVANLDGIGGMFGASNEVGVAFSRAVPLMVAVAQNAPRLPIALVAWAAVPLSMLGVVSTYSRGSFLALVAATLAFAMLHRRRAIALSGIAVFAIAVLIVVPIPVQYFDRLQTIRTYEEDDERSALSRLHFWKVALEMASEHPLGVGLKNYQANYDRYDFEDGYFGTRRDVHSTHLQVLAEMGFLGFMIWVGLLGGALVYLFRIRKRARDERLAPADRRFLQTMSTALIASLTAFIVGGTFNSLLVDEINWYTFALIAALDLVSRRMITQARSRTAGHATAA